MSDAENRSANSRLRRADDEKKKVRNRRAVFYREVAMMNRLKRAEKTDENRAFSNRKAGLLDEGEWDDKGRKVDRGLRKNRERGFA